MTQPGDSSQPQDTRGEGTATLEDRTEPGGQGSPDTNQAKTEPMPPSTHDVPAPEVPDLESMSVGAGDPQAPSHPALTPSAPQAGGGPGDPAGVPVPSTEPLAGSSEGAPPASGVGTPREEPDA